MFRKNHKFLVIQFSVLLTKNKEGNDEESGIKKRKNNLIKNTSDYTKNRVENYSSRGIAMKK